MASSSRGGFDLNEQYGQISLEDEEEEVLIGGDEDGEEAIFDDRWCLVGKFLTGRTLDFDAMRHMMASLWQPGKGVFIKELDTNRYLFQFYHELDIQVVIDGSPWTFNKCPLCKLEFIMIFLSIGFFDSSLFSKIGVLECEKPQLQHRSTSWLRHPHASVTFFAEPKTSLNQRKKPESQSSTATRGATSPTQRDPTMLWDAAQAATLRNRIEGKRVNDNHRIAYSIPMINGESDHYIVTKNLKIRRFRETLLGTMIDDWKVMSGWCKGKPQVRDYILVPSFFYVDSDVQHIFNSRRVIISVYNLHIDYEVRTTIDIKSSHDKVTSIGK
ncbi:hypothetical protein F8388_024866 [Cannabis sativa]|uniref:DUF4283 domain-containing protein n=1 Tax=Cannabis sativa TaxID=3483 RepID=A0A7J6H709_CANSA|nr:hypothetical protein F8388_024866 [Cannabis sativa]